MCVDLCDDDFHPLSSFLSILSSLLTKTLLTYNTTTAAAAAVHVVLCSIRFQEMPCWLDEAGQSDEKSEGLHSPIYIPKALVLLSHYPLYNVYR